MRESDRGAVGLFASGLGYAVGRSCSSSCCCGSWPTNAFVWFWPTRIRRGRAERRLENDRSAFGSAKPPPKGRLFEVAVEGRQPRNQRS